MVRPLSSLNLALNRGDGAGDPFSPADIANLTWWVDPDDSATVGLSGSQILTINDKVDGTSNAQLIKRNVQPGPNLTTDGGVDWMDCDGATSGRILNVSDSTLVALDPASGDLTVFVVVKPAFTGTASDWNVIARGFTGWFRLHAVGTVGSLSITGFVDESGGAGFRRADSAADVMVQNSKHILRYTLDRTANLMRVHVDGTQVATADISTLGAVTDTAEKFVICGRASGAAQTSFWDGLIGECLFYKATVDSTDAAAVEAYLQAKWGTV